MTHPLLGLTPPSDTVEKKRGRPPGSRNKASGDLLRFISHETQGLTPGQQLARLVMVTPRDVREARKWAEGKGFDVRAMDKVALAMSWKAAQLAKLNDWDVRDAWSVLMSAMDKLMPFVHQKQGSVEAPKVDTRPTINANVIPLGAIGNPSQQPDFQQEISFAPMPLTQGGSHSDEKA